MTDREKKELIEAEETILQLFFDAYERAMKYTSTSTGGCDGLWQNVEIVAVALRFGHCHYGTAVGLRCLDVHNPAGSAHWFFGAAVLLLPPVGVAA